MPITLICRQCGVSFHVRPSWAAAQFCGRACHAISRCVPLSDRFWAKVNPNGPVPPHQPHLGPCWLWTANRNSVGYGMIAPGYGGRSSILAHRASWELANGPVPAGLFVCHHCDTPLCVNPAHLFLGTDQENKDDMVRKGRSPKGERSGARLHPERMRRPNRKPRRAAATQPAMPLFAGAAG